MKKEICEAIGEIIPSVAAEEVSKLMEVPPEETMGDFALPCFSFAKILHKSPVIIAKELQEALKDKREALGIERLEVVSGYLNIFMDRSKYAEYWVKKIGEKDFDIKKPGTGRTVCMDYSSPNIAKNFHVGHLRTTIIGNSIYKIYDKLGYKVVRINHLGDWGTQFGKLIVAYKKWSSRAEVEEKGIEELLRIYIKFSNEVKENPELMTEARQWFIKMEQEDEEALTIWNWFKDISLIEFERIYKLLDVAFDSYTGESFYRSRVPALVETLKEKNLLVESEGARVIDLSDYDMPPCLITKSDGGSIYHSRDIAAVLYRKEKYNFYKCLYVTGSEQSLHFKQVFKAVNLMGYDWTDNLVHIPYGLVRLNGAKLATRDGNIIYAEDLLKEAIERAKELIEKKNPDLPDIDETARKVGVGAVIFHDLFNQRIKDIDFSWNEVMNFDGATGPYVQYTYARAKSILSRNQTAYQEGFIDYGKLTDTVSYGVIKALSGYEEAINMAADRYEPSIVARYVISLASAFNKFYNQCSILSAPEEEKKARLLLVDLVQRVIKDCSGLLGIQCPEKM